MKQKIAFLFAILTIGALGSGTYKPPSPAWLGSLGIDSKDVEEGQVLFENPIGESKGASCAQCHQRDGKEKFKRSKLKKLEDVLGEKIAVCLKDPSRSNYPDFKNSENYQLAVYLISYYKLSKKALNNLKPKEK